MVSTLPQLAVHAPEEAREIIEDFLSRMSVDSFCELLCLNQWDLTVVFTYAYRSA